MELLRNLLGNLAAGIIRLLVAVGILAAAYLLVVRPALDTTKEISHEVDVNVQRSIGKVNLSDIGRTIEDVNRGLQREIRHSFHQSRQHGQAERLVRCIHRAGQDVGRIQGCTRRY